MWLGKEQKKLLVVGAAWISMGVGTYPLADEPAWTVFFLSTVFVLGGLATMAYALKPYSTDLYAWAYGLTTQSCLGRALFAPIWKYMEQDSDWVFRSFLTVVFWVLMYWFTCIFWEKEVGGFKLHSIAYRARKKELRGDSC